jgi:2-succinyl-5-enolpyruvyl-6-hydroxy-3-cyclohexene-1-carboxylate synthase
MNPPDHLDASNVNSLWCGVLAETLARCGVSHAVIAPGSRSTPLAFAFARHPGIEAISVLDERSAAFFALGLARRNGRPTVLVCTSGTAAANFFPAGIAARRSWSSRRTGRPKCGPAPRARRSTSRNSLVAM